MNAKKITIRGRQYIVRSDDTDGDLQSLATYVDGKIQEIALRTAGADDYTVAMLAALNIASDFARHKRVTAEKLQEVDRDLASTSALLDGALPVSE